MTKNEAVQVGREQGYMVGKAFAVGANLHLTPEEVWQMAADQAISSNNDTIRPSFRNAVNRTAYDEAFVQAFQSAWSHAHSELPEVKAEALARHISRKLDNMTQAAQGTVVTFNARMNDGSWDAAYRAFDWGQDALMASATLKAAANCKEWFKGGVETLRTQLMVAVLNGAKYPKQSTSQMSNLLEQALLAAYADVLDEILQSR